jgi:broad-specificity NMP kinase
MADIVFIHGAPGIGKSSVSRELHKQLGSPFFEFGWIPEFRQKQDITISYELEEKISFENLTYVVQNYNRHGFTNVIVTDLRDHLVVMIDAKFKDNDYLLITLYTTNERQLKSRVLEKNRSSQYRNYEEAIEINSRIKQRTLIKNEHRIDVTNKSITDIVQDIISINTSKVIRHTV